MTQPVYSHQHLGAGGSDSYTYTCPENYVALVSCLDGYFGVVALGFVLTFAGDAGQVIWRQSWDAGGEVTFTWRGKHVLTPGQSVTIYSTIALGTADFDCNLAGDLLSQP